MKITVTSFATLRISFIFILYLKKKYNKTKLYQYIKSSLLEHSKRLNKNKYIKLNSTQLSPLYGTIKYTPCQLFSVITSMCRSLRLPLVFIQVMLFYYLFWTFVAQWEVVLLYTVVVSLIFYIFNDR